MTDDANRKNQADHWNLRHIMPVEDVEHNINRARQAITLLNKWYEKLAPQMSLDDFREYIAFSDDLTEQMQRLWCFASLSESTDQKSATIKLIKEKVKELYLEYEQAERPCNHWLIGKTADGKASLDDHNATRLFAAVPDQTYLLHLARKNAQYTLGQHEENIISAMSSNGIQVIKDMRKVLETQFTYRFKPHGEDEQIIRMQAELTAKVSSPNPHHREAAYRALLSTYQENADTLFMIYQAVVKNWVYQHKLRGFISPIARRNIANDIPDQAIESLLRVCTAKRKIFRPFFDYKASMLGTQRFRRFDMYAPLGDHNHDDIPYPQAKQLVLDNLARFSPHFCEHAKSVIEAQHVDVFPSPTKQSGAFCSTVSPSIIPYVLLNYMGRSKDVQTLAHELGHAAHSLYAKHHSIQTQHATLPLAETASTFAEMIVFEALIDQTKNIAEKNAMLAEKIADAFNGIIRQNYFVKFELLAHQRIPQGTTVEELSDEYTALIREQFGDDVDIDPLFRYEWLYIPHIVSTPFYCYAYSFGELLSLALYADYKQKGQSVVADIERIFAAGGSENPQQLLLRRGYDITQDAFWEKSFSIIEQWITSLTSNPPKRI